MIIGLDASRANITERTGTEKYAWEVLHRLLRLLPGHHLRLYAREPLRPEWLPLPPEVDVRVLTWPPGVLWSHVRLSWELWRHPPDLLFVPADTVPLVHPPRTVTTIHDVAFERWPELYRGRSVQRRLGWLRPLVHLLVRLATLGRYSASERDYHRWSVRQALRASPSILTVSEFSKREIVELLGVRPERITVTPLGVRQSESFSAIPSQQRHQVRQQLNLNRPFYLFVGRLESKKNIGLVMQGYDLYRQRSTHPLDLVLIGNPGYGWEEVEAQLRVKPYRGSVHVLGWQPDPIVDVLQVSATALICISKYEGFGIPAVESLSAGVPVLSSRQGALPEVLGSAAHYIDQPSADAVANGLVEVTSNEQVRSACIKAGLAQAKKFTWEKTAARTADLLLAASLRS